jgi:hypothetical protein
MIDSASRFLSAEDLDLANLPDDEFDRLAYAALRLAQATNDLDAAVYRHGCIAVEPGRTDLLPLIRNGSL